MTGRIVHLNASEHAAVDALLPWYVNGTLRGDELERVEGHLAACQACRREVEWLRDVFTACAAMAPLPDAPASLTPGPPSPGRPVGSSNWRGKAADSFRSTPPWMRALMAAELAGLVILGTLLALDSSNEPTFRTLGSEGRTPQSGAAFAVMFDPTITEAELRRVVNGIGARIVDGPTTTHAFVLEVPAASSNAAVEKLRAEPSVRFAEPLGPRATPRESR
jgi:anti-sigma factor RsiW